jgi:thiamine-monophosphate kinase
VTQPGSRTVAEMGEFGVVSAVTGRLGMGDDVLVGPGDDAALVAVPTGAVLVSTDLLVEGRHFRRDWSSATDIGHKAAAQGLADITAMGGRATAIVVALGAAGDLPVSWTLELTDGLAAEASAAGASVVGGDLAASDVVVLAVTALGVCDAGPPVRRTTAQVGDVVAVCGRLGWAAAGLAVLSRGFRSPRAVVDAHRRPSPPYRAGPEAVRLGATAMVDVSDGLLADLGHIAEGSEVAIDVRSGALQIPEPLTAVGAALGADPLSFVLTGGDDHALAATFGPEVPLPAHWQVIGSVAEGSGVTVDAQAYAGAAGHEHFR